MKLAKRTLRPLMNGWSDNMFEHKGCYPSAGAMQDRYDVYVACMEGTGEYIKTFDEWMDS
jgi:hypothetical protein